MKSHLFFVQSVLAMLAVSCSAPAPVEPQVVDIPLPDRVGDVNDFSQVFTAPELAFLNAWIQMGRQQDSIDMVVVTVDSTHVPDKDIRTFTLALGEKWKVGETTNGMGTMVVFSPSLSAIQVRHTNALSAKMSDAMTQKAIDSIFVPLLREDQYLTACMAGLGYIREKSK